MDIQREGIPTITRIPTFDGRVHLYRSDPEVDCFAVITERYVVVVDTFGTPEEAQQMMTMLEPELSERQLLVVNTHQHYDHAWGNSIFAADGPYPAPILAHHAGLGLDAQLWVENAAGLVQKQAESVRFASVKLTQPTLTFSDKLRIDGGDLTLELIPAPGHCADQVVVWIPELACLLAADALEFPFPYSESPAEYPTMLATLRKLAALEPRVVLPCHGGTTEATLIEQNIAYFARLEKVAKDATIPADWQERRDLGSTLGYPFEQALADLGVSEVPNADFYRDRHQDNLRTVLAHFDTK